MLLNTHILCLLLLYFDYVVIAVGTSFFMPALLLIFFCFFVLFYSLERMNEYRMARTVLMSEVSGGRVRGRPRFGWMADVKVVSGNRNDGRGCVTMHER